jgi:hypothetical protein
MVSSSKGEKLVNSVDYWNGNARWYRLWVEHNNYHESIIETLRLISRPGWKVLDIGGGGGVLAVPLMMNQCYVIVLEPSQAMRDILEKEVIRTGMPSTITVDTRKWEDIDPIEFCDHDLIMACNSLHLVMPGFKEAFQKVFISKAPHIFIVTEQPLNGLRHYAKVKNYQLIFSDVEERESSFVYYCRDEAVEHWSSRYGTDPNDRERQDVLFRLTMEEGHFRLKGKATVYSYYWKQMEADRQ